MRPSVRMRSAAAATAIAATLAAAPADGAAVRTVARYDAAKVAVGSPLGGYGWAAWTTQRVRSSGVQLRLRSRTGRRYTVPIRGSVNGQMQIVRIQDPGGTPRVVLRLERCLVKGRSAFPERCAAGLVDLERRRFEPEPAWLAVADPYVPADNLPAAIEDRTVVRLARGGDGTSCIVTATDLDRGVTTLPPIPDCEPWQRPFVRGSRILVTTGTPSGAGDYRASRAGHLLDLAVPGRGWATVSARQDVRTGSTGSDGGVLLGDQVFDLAIDSTDDPWASPPVKRSAATLRRRELTAAGPLPEPVVLPTAFDPSALRSVASTDHVLVVQSRAQVRRKVGKRTKTIDQVRIRVLDPAALTAAG